MTDPLDRGVQLTLVEGGVETSVYLHGSGDHVVVRYANTERGDYALILAHGSEAWERAVRRGMVASAFVNQGEDT